MSTYQALDWLCAHRLIVVGTIIGYDDYKWGLSMKGKGGERGGSSNGGNKAPLDGEARAHEEVLVRKYGHEGEVMNATTPLATPLTHAASRGVDDAVGERTDQPAIGAAQLPAGHHDLAAGIGDEDIGDIDVVGDDDKVLVAEQPRRHRLHRRADIHEDRGVFRDRRGASLGNRRLFGGIERPAVVITDIGGSRRQHRAAARRPRSRLV